ncbi:glycosyltransferase family 2 protein [Halobium palmae]|uniref:Glycosyltransferase family 2 protein n=1 Tax=Halobium palmae TaxID=1776492 RepID=A0ABD5RU97_9EURY
MSEVTAVVTTYNSEGSAQRAINSVLAQTIDCEIIVVDDASTDETMAVLQEYNTHSNIKIIRHSENKGGSAARNTGIKNSSTKYIALLDGDDLWNPTKIQHQLERIKSDNSAVAVYCDYSNILQGIPKVRNILAKSLGFQSGNNGGPRPEGGVELIPHILSMDFDLGGSSTLLFERTVVDEIGGFDERFPRHQDWEFLIRLLKKGRLVHVDQELVVKYEDGLHSIESVKMAKFLFLDKFEIDINASKKSRREILDSHYRHLAMVCLQNGKFQQGIKYLLKKSKLSPNEILFALWSLIVGFYTRIVHIYTYFAYQMNRILRQ